MALEDEENEALEEVKNKEVKDEAVRDVEDEDEEGLPSDKKTPNKALIVILSLVVFFALLMLFRGEKKTSLQVAEGPSITTSVEENLTEIPLPSEEAFEGAVVEQPSEQLSEQTSEEPSAGGILIQSKDGVIETSTPDETPSVSIPEKELAFFEALKKNRENRPTSPEQDNQLSGQTKKAPALPEQKPAVKTAPTITPLPKVRVQNKKAVPAAVSSFTIQLGAFGKESSASALSERLTKNGYDAYILAVSDKLFRVRVGTFRSRADAKVVAEQIKSSDRIAYFIVPK